MEGVVILHGLALPVVLDGHALVVRLMRARLPEPAEKLLDNIARAAAASPPRSVKSKDCGSGRKLSKAFALLRLVCRPVHQPDSTGGFGRVDKRIFEASKRDHGAGDVGGSPGAGRKVRHPKHMYHVSPPALRHERSESGGGARHYVEKNYKDTRGSGSSTQ